MLFLFFSLVKCVLTVPFRGIFVLGDEAFYMETAKTIWFHLQFSNLGNPYPPGYPLVIAPAQFFFPDFTTVYHTVLIANSFLSSLVVFPAYYLSRKFLDIPVSAFLAVLILVLPLTFLYSFVVMSENLFIPLYAFSCWVIIEAFTRDDSRLWALCGAILFFMVFTRSIGIAAVIAILIVIVYEAYTSENRSRSIVAKWPIGVFFVLPLVLYLAWNYLFFHDVFSLMNGGLFGYSTENYAQSFLTILWGTGGVITIGKIILNEAGYYLLAGFFLIVIFAFYGLIGKRLFRSEEKSRSFVILFLYTFVTSLVLVLISTAHLAAFYAPFGYTLLMGRYLEPTIPILCILGVTGYAQYAHFTTKTRTDSGLLVAVFSVLFVMFVLLMPLQGYKWINTLMLYDFIFFQQFQVAAGIRGFYLLLAIMYGAGVGIILARNVRFLILFGMVLSLISLAVIYPVMLDFSSRTADTMEDTGEMARILASVQHDRLTLYDQDLMTSSRGTNLFYCTQWWTGGRVVQASTDSIDKGYSYVLSGKDLPYESLAYSNNLNVTLYRT